MKQAAAALARQLGANAEVARDLAYRLYPIRERKRWAQEALAYNALVVAWPEIKRTPGCGRAGVRQSAPGQVRSSRGLPHDDEQQPARR